MESTLRRGGGPSGQLEQESLQPRMQKPTGKPGVLSDCIYQSIAIEHHIQDEANAAILGADSVESGHFGDDGDSALSEVVAENLFDYAGNDSDEEDEEVAAVNEEVAAVNEEVVAVNVADVSADDKAVAVVMVNPHPQSLSTFVGGGVEHCHKREA
jgi:hypothetical protein